MNVDDLPRRTAHATHALVQCTVDTSTARYGPFTAAEVAVFDAPDASTPLHTGAALAHARRLGLASLWGTGYWAPTTLALDHAADLETRYLNDTATDRDRP